MNRAGLIVRPDPLGRIPDESGPKLAEIGFGNGEFLVHLAHRRPEATVYGFEVSMTCVEKALSRASRLGTPNMRLMLGDARFMLRQCFADDTFERIYMSFPCPWPKERHARRRVTAEGFSGTLAAVLKMGGVFELATDEGWYADEVASVLGAHPALMLEKRLLNHRREITTKYERRWLDEGKDIHHLYVAKRAPWTARRLACGEGEESMHIHVPQSQLDTAALSARIEGQVGRLPQTEGGDPAVWVFRSTFAASGVLLVETVCTDEGFEQKFYFKIVQRNDGLLVKLDGVHVPYLTPAVRAALADLARLAS